MKKICLVVVDVRSAHNVGSLLRTADGFAVDVILVGITPYPENDADDRLPHIARKAHASIAKTALGAEKCVNWRYIPTFLEAKKYLKKLGYILAALEQTETALPLQSFKDPGPVALVVGPEVTGLDKTILEECDVAIEIPMFGKKESFNVSVAAGIGLYQLRLHN